VRRDVGPLLLASIEQLCYTLDVAQVYRRKATSVSLINYHFVWCPKYRWRVLGGPVKVRLEELVREALALWNRSYSREGLVRGLIPQGWPNSTVK
jgi:hypothetical protein